MAKKINLTVVLPAYQAEKTLIQVVRDIRKYSQADKLILVDDGSSDQTVALAHRLKVETYVHIKNKGYGANQKTCYTAALKYHPQIVVMLHPDGQHDPREIPQLIAPILAGQADAVVGSRMLHRQWAVKGGMPLHKQVINRFITSWNNFVLGTNLTDHLSGYRAYSIRALQAVPLAKLADDFLFDQEFTFWVAKLNLSIVEVAVSTHYYEGSSALVGIRGLKYLLSSIRASVKYFLTKEI